MKTDPNKTQGLTQEEHPTELACGTEFMIPNPRSEFLVRYTVERPLGVGGQALCYLARRDDGIPAVLKIPRLQGVDPYSFVVEEKIAGQLAHENVIPFLGSTRDSNNEPVLAFARAFENPLFLLNRP